MTEIHVEILKRQKSSLLSVHLKITQILKLKISLVNRYRCFESTIESLSSVKIMISEAKAQNSIL
jgi:hypothetical protein